MERIRALADQVDYSVQSSLAAGYFNGRPRRQTEATQAGNKGDEEWLELLIVRNVQENILGPGGPSRAKTVRGGSRSTLGKFSGNRQVSEFRFRGRVQLAPRTAFLGRSGLFALLLETNQLGSSRTRL